MDDVTSLADAQAPERRFLLSVWPQTPTSAWHAQVRTSEAAPALRFDRPTDLVLYLTELSRPTDGTQRGLR